MDLVNQELRVGLFKQQLKTLLQYAYTTKVFPSFYCKVGATLRIFQSVLQLTLLKI